LPLLREFPTSERPRERLARLTPSALPDRELLAILIETGQPGVGDRPARSALDVAVDLLSSFGDPAGQGSLRRIMTSSVAELCAVRGIGPAKATKILAALDLGRRAVEEERGDRARVRCAADVYALMRLEMRDLPHEEFHVLLLSTQNDVLRRLQVTRGYPRCVSRAPEGGLPRRDHRVRREHYSGSQPPERGSHPFRRRSGRHETAPGRGQRHRDRSTRPCHRRRTPICSFAEGGLLE
jgi:DNA repair protein RadC